MKKIITISILSCLILSGCALGNDEVTNNALEVIEQSTISDVIDNGNDTLNESINEDDYDIYYEYIKEKPETFKLYRMRKYAKEDIEIYKLEKKETIEEPYTEEQYKYISNDVKTYVWTNSPEAQEGYVYTGVTRKVSGVRTKLVTTTSWSTSKDVEGYEFTGETANYKKSEPIYIYDIEEKDIQAKIDEGYNMVSYQEATRYIQDPDIEAIWSMTPIEGYVRTDYFRKEEK